MNKLAPIVLFVYNRPKHTKLTVEALQKNKLAIESELFIYSDNAKNEDKKQKVNEVRKYIQTINGFKKITIIKREKNWGLANSIIDGVTKIINKNGKVIVLEDDLITSANFLRFMNKALDTYEKRNDVFSVTGFSFTYDFMRFDENYNEDVYMNIRPMSWSFATWGEQWDRVDWSMKNYKNFILDNKQIEKFNSGGTDLTSMLISQKRGMVDSWYVRWSNYAILNELYTVYPTVSFVNNIGHDNSGTHSKVDIKNIFNHNELNVMKNITLNGNVILDLRIVENFNKGFALKKKAKFKQSIKIFLERYFYND
jgi:hypothetical protein